MVRVDLSDEDRELLALAHMTILMAIVPTPPERARMLELLARIVNTEETPTNG